MALGSTNISLSAVKTALGYTADSNLFNIGTSALINKWAKYKPVRGTFPQGSGTYGLDLTSGWSYLKPRGIGYEGVRLGDFRSYEHAPSLSFPPIHSKNSDVVANSSLYPSSSPNSFSWVIRKYTTSNLTASDLGLNDYYYGIKIVDPSDTVWYKTKGQLTSLTGSGATIGINSQLVYGGGSSFSYIDLPFDVGNYQATLFISSTQAVSWTNSAPSNIVLLPSETHNGVQYINSSSFSVNKWMYLSDPDFAFSSAGGESSNTCNIYFPEITTFTVQSKPSWCTVAFYNEGTLNTNFKVTASSNSGAERTGTIVIESDGITASASVVQLTSATTTYTWEHHPEIVGYSIIPVTHGMSDGYTDFSLYFLHDYEGTQYISWSISTIRTGVLASGSGDPDGILLDTSYPGAKTGTLSQAILSGDVVTINIDVIS